MTEFVGRTLKEEVLSVLPEAYPEETQHLLEVLGLGDLDVAREPGPALAMTDALLLACLDLLEPCEQAIARERLAPHLDRLARRAGLTREREARLTGSARVEFRSMAAE